MGYGDIGAIISSGVQSCWGTDADIQPFSSCRLAPAKRSCCR